MMSVWVAILLSTFNILIISSDRVYSLRMHYRDLDFWVTEILTWVVLAQFVTTIGIRIGTKRYWYKTSSRDQSGLDPGHIHQTPSGSQTQGKCSSQLNPCQLIKSFVKFKASKMIHKVSTCQQMWFIRQWTVETVGPQTDTMLTQNGWQFDRGQLDHKPIISSSYFHPQSKGHGVTGMTRTLGHKVEAETENYGVTVMNTETGWDTGLGPIWDHGEMEMSVSLGAH